MTADGADCSQLLPIPPPFVNTEPLLLLAQKTELHVDVVEVPPQGASGALYDDRAALEGDVDCKTRRSLNRETLGTGESRHREVPSHVSYHSRECRPSGC